MQPSDYSDMGQAKVLVREYGDELKFTDATDFLRYNGTVWDENSQASIGAVEEFLDMQLVDAQTEMKEAGQALMDAGVAESDVRTGGKTLEKAAFKISAPDMEKLLGRYLSARAYFAFVMKYRNFKYIVSTQNAAKPMVATDINEFDADENLLNTPSATYDISKGVAGGQLHNPADLITKITKCAPGDDGRDLWMEALDTFFCGDRELIDYVQKTVGLAAVGKVYQEALIIAYGEGRNGKSTFWNTVARVMGTYAGTMSADTLTAGCRRNVMPEIAELKGKRLVIAAELEEGTRLSTSVLKKLCSTDLIHAEKKYKQPHSFKPTHTVVLYTNHLPRVSASDEGTWRRLIVIPFQAKIEGASDIKNYSDYLFEHAGPSIMTWIIEGAKKVIDLEFHVEQPQVVKDAIAEYRGMNDWLSQFMEECCDTGNGLEVKSSELYEEYRAYCLRTGEYARNSMDFASTLDKAGYVRKRKKSGMWVQGIQIKDKDFGD
jgi:P4 family phage/plasmid primase-like protien